MTRNSQPQHLQHLISNIKVTLENTFVLDNIKTLIYLLFAYVMSFLIDYNVHFSENEVLANGQEEIKDLQDD